MTTTNLQMTITQIELLDTNYDFLPKPFKNGWTDSLPEANITSL